MKKLAISLIGCLLATNAMAQQAIQLSGVLNVSPEKISNIKMSSDYGAENKEVTGILRFQNIDLYRAKFIGSDLKGKQFVVICKELWNGKVKKIDTMINTKKQKLEPLTNDTLTFATMGVREEDKLKLLFDFPRFGLNKKYKAIQTDDYSLRSLGDHAKIELNKSFPAFAYILPYENEGWKMYCAVDSSGVDVEDWGKKFKIKHYLIFEMMFFE